MALSYQQNTYAKEITHFLIHFYLDFFPTWCQLKLRILHVDAWQIYSGHIPPRIKPENSGAKEFNFCLCPNKRPTTNFWRALCLASGPFPEKKVNRNDKFSTTFFLLRSRNENKYLEWMHFVLAIVLRHSRSETFSNEIVLLSAFATQLCLFCAQLLKRF